MKTRPMKMMSLAIIAAAALLLLFGGGLSSTTSEGVSITIDGVTKTWADYPSPIALNNNDVLTLRAGAGDPSGERVIQIAANANVTIIGDAAKNFIGVRISEAFGETSTHNVNITNLKITATGGEGYIHHKGIINLTGANEIKSGNTGIYSVTNGVLTIKSTSNGTLLADGGASQDGIHSSNLSIEGNAKVTAAGGGGEYGVYMLGSSPAVAVAANASLTSTTTSSGIAYTGTGTLGISCNGTMTLGGSSGIFSTMPVNISGSGTITAAGSYSGLVTGTLSISGTTINSSSLTASGVAMYYMTTITLKNGAVLNSTAGTISPAVHDGSFIMEPGTTVKLTNGFPATETHSFTMFAAGQWLLSGDASFSGGSNSTSSPASIDIAGDKTGTIRLATPPGITAPVPLTLNEGYAATSTGAFTLTGLPAPTVTKTDGDAKITWNNTTKKLDVATGLAAGSYPVDLKASNGATPDATITYTVTVNAGGGGVTVTSVTVDPSSVSVQKGTTKTFTATVNGSGGTPSQAVTWSVTGQADTATTINSSTGLLTVAAGETATTLTVRATSVADTTKSGTSTVTVTAEDPGGGGENGGGSNTILWVAVAAVIVVALLGLLFFFFKKP